MIGMGNEPDDGYQQPTSVWVAVLICWTGVVVTWTLPTPINVVGAVLAFAGAITGTRALVARRAQHDHRIEDKR